MFEPIARVLAFFYSLPVVGGSYGFSIIMLTGAVMIVLMPLTLKATRSTIKMQQVQPQLKELQKKHKDDKTTLNQELMALYSENGINPVGGCLPMLAQLPVFLVLFNVLRGLSRRVSDTAFFAISDRARVMVGGEALPPDTFDPRYLSTDSEMYIDLSQDDEMAFGPFDLSLEALDVLRDSFFSGIPYVILILFVVGTSFYQQRQVSARRSGGAVMNPQQEMILKFLPLLSGVWSFVFPAGLVLYWATSNVFRIGQQGYITRAFYGEDQEAPALVGGSDDSDADSDHSSSKSTKSDNGSSSSAKPKKPASSNRPKDSKSSAANRSSNGSQKTNGSPSDDGPPANREEAWAKRRQARASAQSAARNRSADQSSRVTPKGTKPSGSKKKRKR